MSLRSRYCVYASGPHRQSDENICSALVQPLNHPMVLNTDPVVHKKSATGPNSVGSIGFYPGCCLEMHIHGHPRPSSA